MSSETPETGPRLPVVYKPSVTAVYRRRACKQVLAAVMDGTATQQERTSAARFVERLFTYARVSMFLAVFGVVWGIYATIAGDCATSNLQESVDARGRENADLQKRLTLAQEDADWHRADAERRDRIAAAIRPLEQRALAIDAKQPIIDRISRQEAVALYSPRTEHGDGLRAAVESIREGARLLGTQPMSTEAQLALGRLEELARVLDPVMPADSLQKMNDLVSALMRELGEELRSASAESGVQLGSLPDYVNFATFAQDATESARHAQSTTGSIRDARLKLARAASKTATAFASAQQAMTSMIAQRQEQVVRANPPAPRRR